MKVYKIIANGWGYDQFDSIAVVAKNEERALEMAETDQYFESDQYPLKVEELDMTKEQIILGSFNAG